MLKSHIPPTLLSWLQYSGSLTKRLSESFPGVTEVRVHAHGMDHPTNAEAESLGQLSTQKALVREITLQHCEDGVATPLVYARSVIPATTLVGENKILLSLGNRSLGDYLFQDESLQRSAPEIIRLQQADSLFNRALKGVKDKPDTLWGRYSIFTLRGRPLRVAEFFLPECLQEVGTRPQKLADVT